jgi:hypothetical protein
VRNRFDELKTALHEHIKERKFSDDRALLTWLISSLEEWVEQVDPGAFTCQRIAQTDFFGMTMVIIEIVDEIKSISELKPMFPEREWIEFRNALTWLEKTRDREEASLVERTYRQFKSRFAVISGQDSKTTRTEGNQSLSQNRLAKTEGVSQQSLVEFWPSSTLLSPLEIKTSRAILSLAILLLLGGVLCFVFFLYQEWILVPAHFGALEGFRSSPDVLAQDTGNLSGWCFFLSVLFFSGWAVYRLWFKVWRNPQN